MEWVVVVVLMQLQDGDPARPHELPLKIERDRVEMPPGTTEKSCKEAADEIRGRLYGSAEGNKLITYAECKPEGVAWSRRGMVGFLESRKTEARAQKTPERPRR